MRLVGLILFNTNQNIYIYSDFTKTTASQTLLSILIFFMRFITSIIWLTNTSSFIIVTSYHYKKLTEFYEMLIEYRSSDFNSSINSIANRYYKMRTEYSESIDNLNLIFTS